MRKHCFKRSRFTLIEVVVVIIILVTLASIATPIYLNYVKKANVGAATTQVKLLEDALTGYKLDIGSYPDTATGLRALVENVDQNEKWDGPIHQAGRFRRIRGATITFTPAPANTATSIWSATAPTASRAAPEKTPTSRITWKNNGVPEVYAA